MWHSGLIYKPSSWKRFLNFQSLPPVEWDQWRRYSGLSSQPYTLSSKYLCLVNIYVDNTTIYRCTSKSLDDQNLATDLAADLTLMAQWGCQRLAYEIQYGQNQIRNIPPLSSKPQIFTYHDACVFSEGGFLFWTSTGNQTLLWSQVELIYLVYY